MTDEVLKIFYFVLDQLGKPYSIPTSITLGIILLNKGLEIRFKYLQNEIKKDMSDRFDFFSQDIKYIKQHFYELDTHEKIRNLERLIVKDTCTENEILSRIDEIASRHRRGDSRLKERRANTVADI